MVSPEQAVFAERVTIRAGPESEVVEGRIHASMAKVEGETMWVENFEMSETVTLF